MDILCTFKFKKERGNSKHGWIKASDHIQVKINIPNPSQEPPASPKALNHDLEDMDVLCLFKIKVESHNLEHGCIKDQGLYPNQDQDAKFL